MGTVLLCAKSLCSDSCLLETRYGSVEWDYGVLHFENVLQYILRTKCVVVEERWKAFFFNF